VHVYIIYIACDCAKLIVFCSFFKNLRCVKHISINCNKYETYLKKFEINPVGHKVVYVSVLSAVFHIIVCRLTYISGFVFAVDVYGKGKKFATVYNMKLYGGLEV
jgi:hypothetical protein